MEKEAVVATSNIHKIEEFKRMLEPLGFKVYSLKDFNIDLNVEETGSTFEENALIKARYISNKLPNKIIFSDDSGLEVHALNNFPGIYSQRFMENSSYEDKQNAIIKMLEDKKDRGANFTSAIALVNFKNEDKVFVGKTQGEILYQITGENGFGYDPIFYSYELKKSFGVASPKEKDSVSHRGKALKLMLDYLKENLD